MSPRVSVLTAAYNSGRFLSEAIDSVLRQSMADWELIVVDDASTDGTAEALAAYRDPRLVLLRNATNLGQAGSLNYGLSAARGRYVACLDHDDLAEPTRLETQAAHLDANPDISLLGTWAKVIGPDGAELTSARPPASPALLAWALSGSCPLIHSSLMFRREPVLALGGYDQFTSPAMDYDLWSRLLQSGGRAAVLPQQLCRVRRHDAQQSATRARQMVLASEAVACRHVRWLLGESADPAHVGALMSLFDVAGGGHRHPGHTEAVALLCRLTRKCGREPRFSAVSLLCRSALAAVNEAAFRGGVRQFLAKAARASFAAARLACR